MEEAWLPNCWWKLWTNSSMVYYFSKVSLQVAVLVVVLNRSRTLINFLTFILMKYMSWPRVQHLPWSRCLAYWYKPGRLKSERHLLTSILYWVHFIFFLDASRMHSLYVLNLLCWFWMSPSAYAVSGTPRKKKRVAIEIGVIAHVSAQAFDW